MQKAPSHIQELVATLENLAKPEEPNPYPEVSQLSAGAPPYVLASTDVLTTYIEIQNAYKGSSTSEADAVPISTADGTAGTIESVLFDTEIGGLDATVFRALL